MATRSEIPTAIPVDDGAIGLPALEQQVREQLETLSYPASQWTPPPGDGRHDVVIVGGGQSGLTTAAKLRREGVARVLVLDREPEGNEGPWVTWARMETLRTQKELHGPDAGVPAAAFQSWYVAQHGRSSWRQLKLIPRGQWKTYLEWIRRVFSLEVRNSTEVLDLTSDGETAVVTVDGPAGRERLAARAVVVATGFDGFGGPQLPDFVAGLPRESWMHSSERMDLSLLEGLRVGVVGAGASAFDNAAAALEAGAAGVVQFCRRPRLATLNVMRSWETRGAYRHFAHMDDALKLAFARHFLTHPAPPPEHSVARCEVHSNYELRLGSPVTKVDASGSGLRVTTADARTTELDFLVVATGFRVDLSALPWLDSVRADLALWGDRADVGLDPSSPVDRMLANYPVLDAGMRLQGRDAESSARLRNVYLFGAAGMPSVGPQCGGINTLPVGSDTVVHAVTQQLFTRQAEQVVADFVASTRPEPQGSPPRTSAKATSRAPTTLEVTGGTPAP